MDSIEDRVGKLEVRQRWLFKAVGQILHRLGLAKKSARKAAEAPIAVSAAQQQPEASARPLQWFERPEYLAALEQSERDFARMGEGEHIATICTSDGREIPVRSRGGRALWL